MESLQFALIIVQIFVALALIVLVLLQKSDGDSLSGIGGSTSGINSAISSKTSANILSKATMTLVGIFLINCLVLASISNKKNKAVLNDIKEAAQEQEATNSEAQEPAQESEKSVPQAPKVN